MQSAPRSKLPQFRNFNPADLVHQGLADANTQEFFRLGSWGSDLGFRVRIWNLGVRA